MRLVDADRLFKCFQKVAMTLYEKNSMRYQMVMDILDGIRFAPTVDAVEVVRCKDCKRWEYKVGTSGICKRFSLKDHTNWVSDVDFCSYGARKEASE